MAKRRQRQVDLGSFFEPVARRSCFGDPFGTSQIDHVQLAYADMLLVIGAKLTTLNSDREKGV